VIHVTLQQLTAYIDGELTEASTELVRRHLSECPDCTGRFARLEEQEDWLVRILKDDPDGEFFRRLKESISLSHLPEAGKARDSRGKVGNDQARGQAKTKPPEPAKRANIDKPPARTTHAAPPATPPAPAPVAPVAPTPPAPARAATPTPPPTVPARLSNPLRTVNAGRQRQGDAERAAPFHWIAAALCVLLGISVAYVVWGPQGGSRLAAQRESGSDPLWDSGSPPEPAPEVEEHPVAEGAPGASPGAESAIADGQVPVPSTEDDDGSRTEAPPAEPTLGSGSRSAGAHETAPLAASLAPTLALPSAPAPRRVARTEKTSPKPAPPVPEKLVERLPQHLVPVRTVITETRYAPVDDDSAPSAAAPAPSGPAVASPSSKTASALRDANAASLEAARSKRPETFDAAAAAWERTFALLDDAPEEMAAARREWAQAQYQAWAAEPTLERKERAIRSARNYLLYAPPGPQRDQAWTWLARLKR